jgi:hypothetical protein
MNELTHDLGVTRIYLGMLTREPQRAAGWMHEDTMPTFQSSVRPDAVICEQDGATTYLDFLGAYSTSKVARMLSWYTTHDVRFEFW